MAGCVCTTVDMQKLQDGSEIDLKLLGEALSGENEVVEVSSVHNYCYRHCYLSKCNSELGRYVTLWTKNGWKPEGYKCWTICTTMFLWILYGFFGHEKSWNWTSVLKVMKKILHLSNVVLKNQQVNNFCNVISLLKVEILLHLIIWLLAKNISGGTYCVVFCYQRWPRRMYCTW